jgi:hypothetical protein
MAQAELSQHLSNVSMKKNKDHVRMFEQLAEIETIHNSAGNKYEAEEMIVVILTAAPDIVQ